MRAYAADADLYGHKSITSTLLAAAGIFLSGCATDHIREAGRPAPDCRADSVMYCDVDLHLDVEGCRCVRRGELRDALRSLARR